jgi:NhaP-type Na+/H+ or K+/H+ antiporter
VAAVSRRLSGTPLTPAMVFVALGVLSGPEVLDFVTDAPTSETIRTLAEATLALVLFADASRVNVAVLRRESAIPARLLGIGLPLTIALGALVATALFPALTVAEALLLAVVLAPTDAALGQAVVTEPRLPIRIRQGLNVESGLNDGICVPLVRVTSACGAAADGKRPNHRTPAARQPPRGRHSADGRSAEHPDLTPTAATGAHTGEAGAFSSGRLGRGIR